MMVRLELDKKKLKMDENKNAKIKGPPEE